MWVWLEEETAGLWMLDAPTDNTPIIPTQTGFYLLFQVIVKTPNFLKYSSHHLFPILLGNGKKEEVTYRNTCKHKLKYSNKRQNQSLYNSYELERSIFGVVTFIFLHSLNSLSLSCSSGIVL